MRFLIFVFLSYVVYCMECTILEPQTTGLNREDALENCFKSEWHSKSALGHHSEEYFKCAYTKHDDFIKILFKPKISGLRDGRCVRFVEDEETGNTFYDCNRG